MRFFLSVFVGRWEKRVFKNGLVQVGDSAYYFLLGEFGKSHSQMVF